MPRHNRSRRSRSPSGDRGRPLSAGLSAGRVESDARGDWLVRQVPGAQATKVYRCPGCDHEIMPGVPHVVAWPAAEHGSVADRRHWHGGCWSARGHRGPTTRRW